MKKIICICFLCLCFSCKLFAQNQTNYGAIKLEQKTDFAAADSSVMQASTLLLTTPIDKEDANRMHAGSFLIKWMTGTPDYTFSLDKSLKYFEKSPDLMLAYMAAMCKVALQSPARTDSKIITLNAMKLMITYISQPDYDVKMTGDMKKLKEANDKDQLQSFLNL